MPNPLLAATNRILPALITPLTPSGELDVSSTERLIDHLYKKGVGGLYVTGSTGEGIYLDCEIRKRIAEIAVKRSKDRGQTIVHVGAIQAATVSELADHAATYRGRRDQQHTPIRRRLFLGRSPRLLRRTSQNQQAPRDRLLHSRAHRAARAPWKN